MAQQLRLDAQHQRPVHLQPQSAAIALDRFDAPAHQGKTATAQVEGAEPLRLLPQPQLPRPRVGLGLTLASLEPTGRLEGHAKAQPFGQQLRLQIAPAAVVGMRQGTPVVIARLGADTQTDTPGIGRHQRLQAALRRLGERLGRTPVPRPLGGIDADQAHAAAVRQAQGVAVHHLGHAQRLQLGLQRAEGPGRGLQADRNEKGAHQGRLFQQCGLNHHPAYLLPNTPKRCLKRSIRPPVSSIFCLPV